MRVSLLIPTHALPPLSYRVPASLNAALRPGVLVVAPLSGRPRLGVVVGSEKGPGRATEDVLSVHEELSLSPELLEACRRVSESFAVPLPNILRAALPAGLDTGRYRVVRPAASWPWEASAHVRRADLKKALGPAGLREAEAEGRVLLAPSVPERGTTEWVVVRAASNPDLRRAPRQREAWQRVNDEGGEMPVPDLLSGTGATRATLRGLVERGALRLVRRPAPAPLFHAEGEGGGPADDPLLRSAARAVGCGDAFVWRVPSRDQPDAVVAVARVAADDGRQTLVLAPEISAVDALVARLRRALPPGHAVAAYHSGLGKDRAAVHEAARRGEADVVVGTRAAALLPLARPGAVCVVDEPDGSHRASPGFEGLPVHAREVALARGEAEGAAVVLLSPAPSLRLRASDNGGRPRVRALPPRLPERWPSVRIVDMRGSGAPLSSAFIDACGRAVAAGGRVGVLVDRLGYATAVSCNRCGKVRRCPECDLPLAARDKTGAVWCARCGRREKDPGRCDACGSDRRSPTGLAVERTRDMLAEALDVPVGLATAGRRLSESAPVTVGTAHGVLGRDWDAVLLPDVDGALQGSGIGATERSFRLIYGAAESAKDLLVLQTRVPEDAALRAAARGDYESFAEGEIPRLRKVGYPPFAHLAAVTLWGSKTTVKRAVESRLRPALGEGVGMSAPVPVARAGEPAFWRVLLRSRERASVARAATRAARIAAGTPGLRAHVEVDPEEV